MATYVLRLPVVIHRTGLSRTVIYGRIAEGNFPRPIALGGRAVGWIESEVEQWIEERIAESRSKSTKTAPTKIGGASS
jgi:prophage regulatory protein